jgi:hypothetical protein
VHDASCLTCHSIPENGSDRPLCERRCKNPINSPVWGTGDGASDGAITVEDSGPLFEGFVGSNGDGATLVALADNLEGKMLGLFKLITGSMCLGMKGTRVAGSNGAELLGKFYVPNSRLIRS